MKIVFFEVIEADQARITELMAGQPDIVCVADKLTAETAAAHADAEIVSVFVASSVTREVIDALPALKLIATRSTGYDHIDTTYAQSKGIAIATVPSYGSHTVAEFAFALMLSLSRKIFDACAQLRGGGAFDPMHLQGFDLNGKTLGVIGTGKIGKNVIRIAKGFGMQVIAHDPYPDAAFATEAGFSYMTLEQVLPQADIVTLHVPYMPATHHLLNATTLPLMKRGAYLINTARGELIETEALITALESGQLAGAGLDVLEGERELKDELHMLTTDSTHVESYKMMLEDHVLMRMPQVLITPHLAFNSREAVAEILKTTVDNITGFINNTPTNIVKA